MSSPAKPARVVEYPGSKIIADTSSRSQKHQPPAPFARDLGRSPKKDIPPPYSAVEGGIDEFMLTRPLDSRV